MRTRRLPAAAALGALALYAVFQLRLIRAHTAVPSHDQANYVQNAYEIAEHPWEPFNVSFPARPPFALAPAAWVLGPDASPQAFAVFWLFLRLVLLGAAAALFGASAAPAVVLAALSSRNAGAADQIYLMDGMLEAAGVLLFACLLWDYRKKRVLSAIAVSMTAIALVLIKPAGASLAAPLLLAHAWLAGPWAKARGRLAAFALGALALAAVAASPYGRAAASQYLFAGEPWWALSQGPWEKARALAAVFPPWALLVLALFGRPRPESPEAAGLAYAAALAVWWIIFITASIPSLDARLISPIMPIAAAACLLAAIASRKGAIAAAAAAALAFAWNLSRLGAPVPEVGLLNAARGLRLALPEGARVLTLVEDDYVEPAALALAVRLTGSPGGVVPVFPPWGSARCDLPVLFGSYQWFLTKDRRQTQKLHGDVWTCVAALHALVAEPDSPLAPYMRKGPEYPILEPAGPDKVTLWALARRPPRAALLTAARWVEPLFAPTAGAAAFRAQIDSLKD